jgi:hypothetical protein
MGTLTSSPIPTVLPSSDGCDDVIMPITIVLPSSDGHDAIIMPVATVVDL